LGCIRGARHGADHSGSSLQALAVTGRTGIKRKWRSRLMLWPESPAARFRLTRSAVRRVRRGNAWESGTMEPAGKPARRLKACPTRSGASSGGRKRGLAPFSATASYARGSAQSPGGRREIHRAFHRARTVVLP
jgi:hypothetical protein